MNNDEKLKIDVRKYPIRPHVGVGSVIIYNDQLLLIKRKFNPDAGKWSIPGGHLELGERVKEAAEREALEETGIKIKATTIAGVINKIMFDADGRIEYHYVLIKYNAEILDQQFKQKFYELKPLDDAIDIRFVSFKDIEKYEITESLRELLKEMKII
jgi:ADP-ribose pyrophosphatase